jgi:enoyl-CoA hydratase/carnithine racemase
MFMNKAFRATTMMFKPNVAMANKVVCKNMVMPVQYRMFSDMKFDNILVEKKEGGVALVTLNRPKALNALCHALFMDLSSAMSTLDKDPEVNAIVLTGNEKAFAAGADIKEMQPRTFPDTYLTDMLTWWDQLANLKTPLIGAVNGFALGGGSELAMICDILIAGENAKFGQPEVNLGTIPGMGGTQRLTRAIGKSRSMEMCLTGDFMGAEEAAMRGLVSRVVAPELCVEEALKVGRKIGQKSQPTIAMAKECCNFAYESSLTNGLKFERRMF